MKYIPIVLMLEKYSLSCKRDQQFYFDHIKVLYKFQFTKICKVVNSDNVTDVVNLVKYWMSNTLSIF